MIAAVLHAPRDLTIETRPSLSPGVGEAVVRVEGAGLCGTDYRIWNGDRAVDYPRVMGHELVGRVLALGSGVSGLTPGPRWRSSPTIRAVYVRCAERATRTSACRERRWASTWMAASLRKWRCPPSAAGPRRRDRRRSAPPYRTPRRRGPRGAARCAGAGRDGRGAGRRRSRAPRHPGPEGARVPGARGWALGAPATARPGARR